MLFLPFPSVFQEFIASKVGLLYTFRSKTSDNLRLRCNRRMVGAGHPKSVLALHPRAADKDVLDCIVEHVSHMEHTSDIWRRDNDCIRLPTVGSRLKQVVFQPIFVPFPSTSSGLYFDANSFILSIIFNFYIRCAKLLIFAENFDKDCHYFDFLSGFVIP